MSTIRLPPEARLEQHEALGVGADLPDGRRARSQWERPQGGQCCVAGFGRHDCDDPALARDVQRVDAENLARAHDLGAERQ